MDFEEYHPVYRQLSRTPTFYNDAGVSDPTQMSTSLDPGNYHDTSSGHLNPGPATQLWGLNISAPIRPMSLTQVAHDHQHTDSRISSQSSQTFIPALVFVPSHEPTALALRGQLYAPHDLLLLPVQGIDYNVQTSLAALNAEAPLLSKPEHAATSSITPFSAYQTAQHQTSSENPASSMFPAFAQDDTEWNCLPTQFSSVPQSTIFAQTFPSLPQERSDFASENHNILFHSQYSDVEQEIFLAQPETSIPPESLQDHPGQDTEKNEAFSSFMHIIPDFIADDRNLYQGWSNYNGKQSAQLENEDPVKESQRFRKFGSTTATKSQQLLPQTRTQRHFDPDSGELQGTTLVLGGIPKVRSKLSPQAKALTAQTRKRGACIRCRKLKKACRSGISPYLPCESCVTSNPSIHRMSCTLQAKIDEIPLFRLGPPTDNSSHPLDFFRHRKNVFVSSEVDRLLPDTRELYLTQDMGSILRVKVSPYSPIPGDKTAYKWKTKDGIRRMEMPPYCLSNVEETKSGMLEYANKSCLSYLENLLDSSNKILWDTFNFALRSGKPMVFTALKLWATCRLIEKDWRLCGTDTLGLEPVLDKSCPWAGIVPVTPLMDQQLDQIVIQWVLEPMRKFILTNLKRLFTIERANESWFEISLTVIILLNNSEVQLAHARQFSKRYGMSGRYGPYGKYMESENQFHAARTLLAHFHHICRGSIPLRMDWNSTNSLQYAKPDKEQIEYLVRLNQNIDNQEPYMRALRDNNQYETDLYWCHQMFPDGWVPGHGYIEELPSENMIN